MSQHGKTQTIPLLQALSLCPLVRQDVFVAFAILHLAERTMLDLLLLSCGETEFWSELPAT